MRRHSFSRLCTYDHVQNFRSNTAQTGRHSLHFFVSSFVKKKPTWKWMESLLKHLNHGWVPMALEVLFLCCLAGRLMNRCKLDAKSIIIKQRICNNELKRRKKVHFGRTMHCLPQSLKSTFFEIFSSLRCTMYDFHNSTDTLKFWTEKRPITKTFFCFSSNFNETWWNCSTHG